MTTETNTEQIIKKIEEYVVPILIIICIGYVCCFAYQHYFGKSTSHVDIVTTNGVTQETVSKLLNNPPGGIQKPTDTDKYVYQEITKIRNEKTEPVKYLPLSTPTEDIQKEVDKLKGDVAISEPSDKPGTSIYSISVKRAQHGIGIFVGSSGINRSIRDTAVAGLHVRNKRWVYQIGMDRDGDVDARVAYELIQW